MKALTRKKLQVFFLIGVLAFVLFAAVYGFLNHGVVHEMLIDQAWRTR